MKKCETVEEYFAALPPDAKRPMEQIRRAIKQVAPNAEECISYQIPAFRYKGVLVYYGGFAKHCSFFPANSKLIDRHARELEGLKVAKGTIQFPHGKPIPTDLIKTIVKERVRENEEKKPKRTSANRRKPQTGDK